jgi:hypothetical protein
MDRETLIALRERVIGAKESDRELDADIWHMLTPGVTRKATKVVSSKGLWPDYVIDETRDESHRLIIVPEYTASIDAALALVERVLPGRHKDLYIDDTGGARFCLGRMTSSFVQDRATSPCIAILAALLSALIAKETARG